MYLKYSYIIERKQRIIIRALAIIVFCVLVIYYSNFAILFMYDSMKEKDGWGRNVSRRSLDYVNPEDDTSFLQISSNACSIRKPFVLIMVCSNPKNHLLRQVIRTTWGDTAYKFYNITIFFLVGKNGDAQTQENLQLESNLYHDLIIENFHDTYNNLTLKTIYMFKWVHKHCTEAPYIVKLDDDVYVNMENLYRFAMMARKNDSSKFLVGRVITNAPPYRNDVTHKWYMPYYLWGPQFYPTYAIGVGYMMSKEVALKLYQQSLKTDFIFLEDVFITALNITPIDQEEFRYNLGPYID